MSDIINSRNLQYEINKRLDKLQKRIPRCKESKVAYFELQDLKEWIIENQQANEANEQPDTKALHLHSVVQQRELLIDLLKWVDDGYNMGETAERIVDDYIKEKGNL